MIAAFFAVYVAVTALSLPGAAIMTLAGGALFGLVIGTLIVSFASSIGATLAFLVSRYILRDSVRKRFGTRLAEIDEGLERDGAFYLVTLRLVPLLPFFVINLVAGLTRMKVGVFYLASQIGMLAGTVVFVNAGTQLARDRIARRHPVAGPDRLVRAARAVPADRQEAGRWLEGATRVCALEGRPAAPLRPQPDRHRRRGGRTRHVVHRGGGEGQGDARRVAQDGRRLPELRLRSEQGADPQCDAGVPDPRLVALRLCRVPR